MIQVMHIYKTSQAMTVSALNDTRLFLEKELISIPEINPVLI